MAELDLLGSILSSMERPPAAADGETRRRAREQAARMKKLQEQEKRQKVEFRKRMEQEVSQFIQATGEPRRRFQQISAPDRLRRRQSCCPHHGGQQGVWLCAGGQQAGHALHRRGHERDPGQEAAAAGGGRGRGRGGPRGPLCVIGGWWGGLGGTPWRGGGRVGLSASPRPTWPWDFGICAP
uniref:Uncharacterized protein n=1 Tax=Corvus moneduloides TaxID=1196302 RepID=A0A8U7NTR3_CORMO